MWIGIDIGGMSIKGGLVDGAGVVCDTLDRPCGKHNTIEELENIIADTACKLMKQRGLTAADVEGLGIGCPGSIDDEAGVVRYSCNLSFDNTPLRDDIARLTGIAKVRISNDANCAALGETLFGAGRGAKNSILVTLGTGVGTGIVVNGKLLVGNKSAGAEGGHIQLSISGPKCGCKKRGHFEAYASVTALINQTAAAAKRHPDSLLAQIAQTDGIDGKTVFTAMKMGDKVAKRTFDRYIGYVGMGLCSLANIFWPEVIIIGGGISKEGDALIVPLAKYVQTNAYGAEYAPKIEVVAATLKNTAGIVGAAALCFD